MSKVRIIIQTSHKCEMIFKGIDKLPLIGLLLSCENNVYVHKINDTLTSVSFLEND